MDEGISTAYSEKATHAGLSVTKVEDVRSVEQSIDGGTTASLLNRFIFMWLFPFLLRKV